MKILITNHFPLIGSGSGTYIMNIAKTLVKRGHEVCIILPENTTKISNLGKIKIHPVFFKHEEKIKGQLNFNFPCMDAHPRSSFLFNNMNHLQIKQYKKAFKQAIEDEIKVFKPDLIHAQHIWIISSIAVKYKLPVVLTSHGSGIMCYEETNKFRKDANKACDGCVKIVAISNHNSKLIAKIFPKNKNKIITISNGYDPKVFFKQDYNKLEVLGKLGIEKNYEQIVCFAGRINKNKGIDLLLKSSKIHQNNNRAILIVGDGDENEIKKYKKIQEKLGLKNIFFVGNQNQKTLNKIYNISDVLAVPSRKEAFGLVALEAIACGLPVVATKNGGIVDFITKDVGILVKNGNVKELGEAINSILKGKTKFDKETLSKYARENYSQERLIEQLINVYESV